MARPDAAATPRKESAPRREIAFDSIFSLMPNPPYSVLPGFSITEDSCAKLTPTARRWFLSSDAFEALCRMRSELFVAMESERLKAQKGLAPG